MVLAVLAPRRELALRVPEGWILATAATLLVGCSTMLLIAVALRLAQGLEIRETLRTSAPSSILMTVLSSGLGLALAAVANGDAANLWLLAPALLVVGFGVRVHHRLQRRTDQLETIHTGLAELSAALVADDVAEILMRRSVAAIGAEQAVLVLRVDDRHGSSASMKGQDRAPRRRHLGGQRARRRLLGGRGLGQHRPRDRLARRLLEGREPRHSSADLTAGGTSHGVLAVIHPR
ncbi:MAG: hypothetical protein R2715_03995 [Ilumatobacteraceae bacterium]